ncbi:hypothetical protein YB2330_005389 [Saitoella coloradoensis]
MPRPLAISMRINENTIHPATQQEVGEHFAADAAHSDYLLIQFNDRVWPAEREELKSLRVMVLRFVAGNTYLCYYPPSDLGPLRAIPFVLNANVFHRDLVVAPQLRLIGETDQKDNGDKQQSSGTSVEQKRFSAYIILHANRQNDLLAFKERILDHLGTASNNITLFRGYVEAQLTMNEIESIAVYDEVQSMELVNTSRPCNDEARKGIRIDGSSFSTNAGLTDALRNPTRWEKIAVADTGIDKRHEAFRGAGADQATRVFDMSYRQFDDDDINVANHGCALQFGWQCGSPNSLYAIKC